MKLKKAPPEAETSGGAVIFRRIYQFIVQLTCEILHSTSTTVVSRVVPSLLFRTLMVIVHVPVQLVSIVIASPTFHAVVSSLSVDDQQSVVVVASHAGMVLEAAPSTLALMVIDDQDKALSLIHI